MGRFYGLELRRRVVEAIDGGLSARAAAARFCIAASTAITWHRHWREQGRLAPARQGKPKGSKLDAHAAFILDLVEAEKDIALYEIAERLEKERGVRTCPATIWYFFDKRAITHKKRRDMHRNSSGRTSSPGGEPGSRASSSSTRRS